MTKHEFHTPPSLIKWTGSKRLLAQKIQKYIPDNYHRYFEPFLGGGSILFNNCYNIAFANDIYSPLIEIWDKVKNNPDYVVDRYKLDWMMLQENFPNHFYIVRDRFNKTFDGMDLLFLSRTAVNGIIRFNNKGEFNNSLHLSRRGMTPEKFEKIVFQWHERLKNTHFFNLDFQEFLEETSKNDFVYLDPPYANSSNRYIKNLDVDELFNVLDRLNSKDVKWALSFDGSRGNNDMRYSFPKELYKTSISINTGSSKVSQVLNSEKVDVLETLYVNYKI